MAGQLGALVCSVLTSDVRSVMKHHCVTEIYLHIRVVRKVRKTRVLTASFGKTCCRLIVFIHI
jgi:hypothetical protein